MRLSVKARVYPTENSEKVMKAIKNIFPDLRLEVETLEDYSLVKGDAETREALEELHSKLRKERILDTARSILLASRQGNEVSFQINKQAAFANRLNLSAESSLGAIEVEIEDEEIEELINWLAPKTFEGREI